MEKKYYIIYETRNLKNNKIYIGMHETDDLDDGYLGSGKRLKRAIRYYGKKFFERKILHFCKNREEMINKEIEIVNESFINRNDVYNLVPGGTGGNFGKEYQFRRASAGGQAFAKRLKNDDVFRNEFIKLRRIQMHNQMISGNIKRFDWSGKEHSKETKLKMSKAAKKRVGNKNSQYGTCWIRNEELNENKKIKKSELEIWLSKGWIKGRKM